MAGLMTGLAIASTAMGAVGLIGGLSGAAKQRKAAAKAEKESIKLMAENKLLAEKKFFEKVNVPLGAYERQFRENTAQQMQNVQALQEAGGRTLAAGVGKVSGQGVQANQVVTDKMAQALYENDIMKAEESRAVNNDIIDINVGAARDASMRARDARSLAGQSGQQAIAGLQAGMQGAADLVGYGGYGSGGRAGKIDRGLTQAQKDQFLDANGNPMTSAERFKKLEGLDPKLLKQIKKQGKLADFSAPIFNNLTPAPSPNAITSPGQVASTADFSFQGGNDSLLLTELPKPVQI